MSQSHTIDTDAGWDSLPTSYANGRKALVLVHYTKARERLDAGVPFTSIYAHYKKLGFDASLATFRKLWKDSGAQAQASTPPYMRLEKPVGDAVRHEDKVAQHSPAT